MDEIMSGIQTYRNPRLVHVFDKMGLIENFGTGIPRTILSYNNYLVKPEFKATENYFIVTLPNVNYEQNDPINDPINDLGLELLRTIKDNPGLSSMELVEIVNKKMPDVTWNMVKNEIKRNLFKYIEHRGSNKTGGYYLKNDETKN